MLKIVELTKTYADYQKVEIFLNANLQIKKGEMVSLVAPSGNGKSTLINLIAGLDRCNKGNIFIRDRDITKMSKRDLTVFRRKNMGIVFQFFNLFSSLTALENVMLPAELDGKKREEIIKRATELLKKMDISDKQHRFPSQLSGGEQQRVAIARALINSPTILLADEPTGKIVISLTVLHLNLKLNEAMVLLLMR
ncbi:MAG: ABC transporter ATP-binding protein [Candidatus Heimdallarchaeaceae archaeon]